MFQWRIEGLDSRLKHAGMTDFELAIYLTQQAAGNEPSAHSNSRAELTIVEER